jgi:hypothetical protein
MIKRSIRLYVKVMRGLVRLAIGLEDRFPFGGYVCVVGMFIPYAILVVCVEAAAQAFPSPLMNVAAVVLNFVITIIFAPALWTGAAISTERFGSLRESPEFSAPATVFCLHLPSGSTGLMNLRRPQNRTPHPHKKNARPLLRVRAQVCWKMPVRPPFPAPLRG